LFCENHQNFLILHLRKKNLFGYRNYFRNEQRLGCSIYKGIDILTLLSGCQPNAPNEVVKNNLGYARIYAGGHEIAAGYSRSNKQTL
jgi:hypothetical protein